MDVDFLSASELHYVQQTKWKAVLPHINEVPFYRKKFEAASVDIEEVRDLSDFTKLPFTTKEELRLSTPMDRTSLRDSVGIAFFFSSSGTTGVRTAYPWSNKDIAVFNEVASRIVRRVGVESGDIALVLAPSGMSAMGYYMTSQYLAAGAGVVPLGVTTFTEITKAFRAFPITMMAAIPVVVSRLSEAVAHKPKETAFQNRLRQFHLGGDYLSNARRLRIEEYWKSDCFDFYGLSEIFGPIAGECSEKDGLHLAADYVLTEVIDPDTKAPVIDGQLGVAVYTTLWDKGAPLLRFWSDDYVVISHERCRCGRTSPRIFYKGRPSTMQTLQGKRIFAVDIEEILLAHPEFGNEWEIKISGTSKQLEIKAYIERKSQIQIDTELLKKIKHEFINQIGIPIDVEDVPFGTFPRRNLKTSRFYDVRR